MHIPRLLISGLSGGVGKTMVSLGLARAFSRSGMRARAFKKGPDYIDAAWLSLAAGSPPANLDPYFSSPDELRNLFVQGASGCDMTLIEGNRGLFDGLDLAGSCSTAEVARMLTAPVVLVLDCTKMTRTAAAVVRGCLHFEDDLWLGGVILNRIGNPRHRSMVTQAVEHLAGVPVLGVLPRQTLPILHERHMGLAGKDEHAHADERLTLLADFIERHVDIPGLLHLARSAAQRPLAPVLESTPARPDCPSSLTPADPPISVASLQRTTRPRIGYVHDAAFWFYYQENLDALTAAGAELVPVSLLQDVPWPELGGLYIGGGLPELHLEQLTGNSGIRTHVRVLAHSGLPIYAECGGFMYLAREIIHSGQAFPMAGVFPCSVEFCDRPQGLGYVEGEVVGENPYHPQGLRFRGHEFHFSRLHTPNNDPIGHDGLSPVSDAASTPPCPDPYLLRLDKGRGMCGGAHGACHDGLLFKRTFASYTHIYAPALPHWASRFVRLCGRNIV